MSCGRCNDALAADARGDTVDQSGKFVVVMDGGIEVALLLHHDFGAARRQPDEIETETGIEGIVERFEPLAKQAVDHLALRRRAAGIDSDRAHRAVGAEELASSRRAPLPCLSIAATSMAASADKIRSDHVFGGDRFGKPLSRRCNPAAVCAG